MNCWYECRNRKWIHLRDRAGNPKVTKIAPKKSNDAHLYSIPRNRDAYSTIQGYVYQVDLTVIERLWWSVKYEDVYLRDYGTV